MLAGATTDAKARRLRFDRQERGGGRARRAGQIGADRSRRLAGGAGLQLAWRTVTARRAQSDPDDVRTAGGVEDRSESRSVERVEGSLTK